VVQRLVDGDAVQTVTTAMSREVKLTQCPKCGAAALIRAEGCDKCLECGHSKCG
jgi:ribonucleoside-diphosphate reductase alpha chain